jgi:hypothetical protein
MPLTWIRDRYGLAAYGAKVYYEIEPEFGHFRLTIKSHNYRDDDTMTYDTERECQEAAEHFELKS